MRCKRAKKLLTEFIDGELNNALEARVKDHLRVCDGCREAEKALRSIAVEPLRNAEKTKAPEEIWHNIKNEITSRKEEGPVFDIREVLSGLLSTRKPAWVLAAAAAIIIAIAVSRLGTYGQYAINSYLNEQVEFFASLDNETERDYPDAGYAGLGTAIEEYLL